MSDPEKSGEPTQVSADLPAPATGAAEAAPGSAVPASGTPPAGSFGATRGSGLARGKRPGASAAPASPAPATGYKPTAVEVIAPASEYKNPFTGETSVNV